MNFTADLEEIGPLVTILLATILLTKEVLTSSGKATSRTNWVMNLAIIPLLIIFTVQIVLRIF